MTSGSDISEAVTFLQDGRVVTLTFARPDLRNALSVQLTDELLAHCQRINDDLSVSCVILTGAGDTFSAGGNIKMMYAREGHFAGQPVDARRSYDQGVQRLSRALFDLQVPIIAAVNGPAMGAGLDIAMMCDIRICSDTARFAESFVKLGLVSAAGGGWFLNRALGFAIAAELTLTGDDVDAARALSLGIVSRVTTPDALMDAARELAGRIARNPPHSIRLNKRLLRESARTDLTTALELAATYQGMVQGTADQHEAVSAVIEKRPPIYTGG